jgi:hypothetical protein
MKSSWPYPTGLAKLRDSKDHCWRVLDPQLASRSRGVPKIGLSKARHGLVLPAAAVA